MKDAKYPVVELFGPTVQGEGPNAGQPSYFVRFGGCDFRCSWCDSMHAVDPARVQAGARRLTAREVLEEILLLNGGPQMVVLTGGNPALFELAPLVTLLHKEKFEVAVETQGTTWRPWIATVDVLVVSPKPPSSGMDTRRGREAFSEFLKAAAVSSCRPTIKIVVFDAPDLNFAEAIAAQYPDMPLHILVGTDVGIGEAETMQSLRRRYRWLCEQVAGSTLLHRAHVRPQLHVIAWGTARGV